MAQLHWRVRGLPPRGLVALVVCLLAPAAARAQTDDTATSVTEIAALASHLASDDDATRARAAEALRSLDEPAVPAIEARLTSLAGHRPATAEVVVALARFRQAAGGTDSMTDRTDLATGIAPVLAVRRDATVVAAAESVLLLRALEHIGTPDAIRLVPEVLGLDGWPWDPEARCLNDRLGARLLPVLLVARASHRSPSVRRWARREVTVLLGDDPGRAVQGAAPVWLAALLRAYGTLRDMNAMRVIVSYVGNEHALVRDAARWALARYGRNAIWTLRDAYSLAVGADPNPQWGSERTMRALFAFYDDARLSMVRTQLDAGLAAFRAGELATMARHYDAVLARAPLLEQRATMTDGYAARGAALLAAGDLDGADRAYRRALGVAADDAARRPLSAQLAYIDAERSLAAGVVDTTAYGRVLALAPDHAAAHARLELVAGERASRKMTRKRIALGMGALVLLALGAWLFRRRRSDGVDEQNTQPHQIPQGI